MDSRKIAAAASGDSAAFAQLYEAFAPKVYNLVLRSVRNAQAAEDICQEVWVRAYQKLDRLREPAAFSTWLYRIASRACIDRARRLSTSTEEELPEQLPASENLNPEAATIRHERERLLWQSMAALPSRQHLALFLREVEGKNYQEIAVILGTTGSAIETLLFRARRGVAEAFERMQSSAARCGQAQKTMAALIDGEATPVQRRAIAAHADECRPCRGELARQRQVSAAYGMLPLFPLPAFLGARIMHGVSAASATSGGANFVARLLGLGAKVKLATAALTITGGITIATLAVPADSPHNLSARSNASAAGGASFDSAGAQPQHASQPPTETETSASLAAAIDALTRIAQGMQLALPPLLANIAPVDNAPAVPAPPLQPAIDALQRLAQSLDTGAAPPRIPLPSPVDNLLTPAAFIPAPGVTPPAIALSVTPAEPLATVALPTALLPGPQQPLPLP
jgi:RNA polymerase sigma-70 factor (ECF subfamily)